MIKEPPAQQRPLKSQSLSSDLVVVGGGVAGACCAITAARAGLKVTLIQDRPVLGGNASSEVRLWILGATAHMGNNNRWAREGGVIDELLVENLWRNPEGNPLIFDTVLLEMVVKESNITLLLNTAVFEVTKADADTIASVRAFCSQNSTLYEARAPLFCDASGDGIVGFAAGAAFRMGAEAREEFGEGLAPTKEYGELLGHSIYFYSKDVGRPVQFTPPSYALADITKIPRFRHFNARDYGCRLWWIEYGGRLDTVHDTEEIKWELWRVAYGAWNHIKNSGQFPEAANLTLEWVGQIPGKRESRRFEGDYILRQQDLLEQRQHPDAVSFGGWSIDLHPADGVYAEHSCGCDQRNAPGIYEIPYRCLFSRNIANLFLAGRIISASHVAFGSTRVIATSSLSAQAVGLAAALCQRDGLRPRALTDPARMRELQRGLLRRGQHIPGLRLDDPGDLARQATITASSRLRLRELPADGPLLPLDRDWAQLLPVNPGPAPRVTFRVNVTQPTDLILELRACHRADGFTPDKVLAAQTVTLPAGDDQPVTLECDVVIAEARYLFYCLRKNAQVAVRCSEQRLTGLLSVAHGWGHDAVVELDLPALELWMPSRRPGGHNLACTIELPLDVFAPGNITNGVVRPTTGPNAWIAGLNDRQPKLTLQWPTAQTIGRVELSFDTDWDHPMESVLLGHPERAMPFCVKHYRLRDAAGRVVAEQTDNHQTRNELVFNPPLVTDRLEIEIAATHGPVPAAVFHVGCYP